MKASDCRLREVKQSGKMGKLRKYAGLYGFDGFAKLSGRTGFQAGWHALYGRGLA